MFWGTGGKEICLHRRQWRQELKEQGELIFNSGVLAASVIETCVMPVLFYGCEN